MLGGMLLHLFGMEEVNDVEQIAAANPEWRWQFRYRGRSVLVPGG